MYVPICRIPKKAILAVLKEEGYILDFEVKEIENNKKKTENKIKVLPRKASN